MTRNKAKGNAEFTLALETWFDANAREFPWRNTTDPYQIWISEIMLQQTQAGRVAGYFFPRFLSKFPNLESLAKATWEDVYPTWDGLGFYRRGKNVLKTAQILQKKFNGELPRDAVLLQSLPGVGAYTSAAIMAFAWDEKLPAIDTNIEKIIQAAFPLLNIAKTASDLMYHATSGRKWNGAMMDLAAYIRKNKKAPDEMAEFFTDEIIKKVFFKPKKKTKKQNGKKMYTLEVGVACIHRDGKYLIQTRPEGKSFSGHWEFPGGKKERGESMRACVKREIVEELDCRISVRPAFIVIRHEFDRVRLNLHFHRCQIQAGEPKPMEKQIIKWVSPAEFDDVGFLETNKKAIEKLKKMRMN